MEVAEEYEVQHFGFSVAELKQETTDMIHEEIDKACTKLVGSISTTVVDDIIAAEIDRKKNNMASDIKEVLKESMETMGDIMTEHFSIPPNVTLHTDQFKWRSHDVNELQLQKHMDDRIKHFMMLAQFYQAMNDELESYKQNEDLLQRHELILEMGERQINSAQSDLNYIDEQAAKVNKNF